MDVGPLEEGWGGGLADQGIACGSRPAALGTHPQETQANARTTAKGAKSAQGDASAGHQVAPARCCSRGSRGRRAGHLRVTQCL